MGNQMTEITNPLNGVRVARVSTIAVSALTQLRPQLAAIDQAGGEVTLVFSQDSMSDALLIPEYCHFKPIFIARDIHLWADLLSLFRLYHFFRHERFDIVHSITPKAALLCSIAAKIAGVPVRLHTYTGQPWVTMRGMKKWFTKWSDALVARLNTYCYTDSFTQRDFLVNEKITKPNKIKVLGHGSLAGIDLARFSQDKYSAAQKNKIKAELHIEASTQIILFVGRITPDKGIDELLHAFNQVLTHYPDTVLLMVGFFEQHIEQTIRRQAHDLCGERVIFTGFSAEPEQYMAIADILCIPSYREGFGSVVIEAAAMGVPAIGTKIYGLIDAVIDGETGLLVEPKNSLALAAAINQLLRDESLRRQMAEKGKERAMAAFDSQIMGQLLVMEYMRLLK